jgi:hypothetical protein
MKDKGTPNRFSEMTTEEAHLWCDAIGRIILAFGAFEFTTIRWIHRLKIERTDDEYLTAKLGGRISAIVKNIDSFPPNPVFAEARELFVEAKRHTTLRNKIAHNPMAFIAVDQRRTCGILDVRDLKGPGGRRVELLDPEEVVSASERIKHITTRLQLLLAECPT